MKALNLLIVVVVLALCAAGAYQIFKPDLHEPENAESVDARKDKAFQAIVEENKKIKYVSPRQIKAVTGE